MESPNRQVLSPGARLLDPWTCPKTLARTLKSAYVFFRCAANVRRLPGRYRCELGLRLTGSLRVGTNIGGEEGQVGAVQQSLQKALGFAGESPASVLEGICADPNLNSRRSRNINGIREELLAPERILVV